MSLCNMALLFGDDAYVTKTNSPADDNSIASLIQKLIHHGKDNMIIIIAEMCVKLMYANRYHDVDTLALLLVMFFYTCYFEDRSDDDDTDQ